MTENPAAGDQFSVLVTGASGLVGHEISELLSDAGAEVVGVSRSVPPSSNVTMVSWDMASEPPPQRLRRQWGAIINAAANTRWTMNPDEALAVNAESVRTLASLASADTRVIHVSTAYATGLHGTTESSELSDYRNTYEWSKAAAERIAMEVFNDCTIVRPPLIVGRRVDGRAARFSGMYTLIRGLTIGTVPAVVADAEARFDAIPVDDLARLLADLATGVAEEPGRVLTIACGKEAPPVHKAIEAVVKALNEWRTSHGRSALECPPLISPDSWKRFFQPFVQEHLTSRQRLILDLLQSFEPYLALSAPLRPDVVVKDVLPCLAASTSYWAEAYPRLASLEPSPWRRLDRASVDAREAQSA